MSRRSPPRSPRRGNYHTDYRQGYRDRDPGYSRPRSPPRERDRDREFYTRDRDPRGWDTSYRPQYRDDRDNPPRRGRDFSPDRRVPYDDRGPQRGRPYSPPRRLARSRSRSRSRDRGRDPAYHHPYPRRSPPTGPRRRSRSREPLLRASPQRRVQPSPIETSDQLPPRPRDTNASSYQSSGPSGPSVARISPMSRQTPDSTPPNLTPQTPNHISQIAPAPVPPASNAPQIPVGPRNPGAFPARPRASSGIINLNSSTNSPITPSAPAAMRLEMKTQPRYSFPSGSGQSTPTANAPTPSTPLPRQLVSAGLPTPTMRSNQEPQWPQTPLSATPVRPRDKVVAILQLYAVDKKKEQALAPFPVLRNSHNRSVPELVKESRSSKAAAFMQAKTSREIQARYPQALRETNQAKLEYMISTIELNTVLARAASAAAQLDKLMKEDEAAM